VSVTPARRLRGLRRRARACETAIWVSQVSGPSGTRGKAEISVPPVIHPYHQRHIGLDILKLVIPVVRVETDRRRSPAVILSKGYGFVVSSKSGITASRAADLEIYIGRHKIDELVTRITDKGARIVDDAVFPQNIVQALDVVEIILDVTKERLFRRLTSTDHQNQLPFI
jgi:hypothetical protein